MKKKSEIAEYPQTEARRFPATQEDLVRSTAIPRSTEFDLEHCCHGENRSLGKFPFEIGFHERENCGFGECTFHVVRKGNVP